MLPTGSTAYAKWSMNFRLHPQEGEGIKENDLKFVIYLVGFVLLKAVD